MIKWLKRLWYDLGNLSKFEFGCKYVFPMLGVILAWGLIGHIFIANLSLESLTPCNGQVTFIGTRLERGSKRAKYYPLKIAIAEYKDEFRLMDKFKEKFTFIKNEVNSGDTITIYKRNKSQAILSWGKLNDIYQIEKNGQVVFSLASVKEDAKKLIPWLILLTSIPWTLYVLYKRRIILKGRYKYPSNR